MKTEIKIENPIDTLGEEDEILIEDDGFEESSPLNEAELKKKGLRRNHNKMERARRDRIKEELWNLTGMIPCLRRRAESGKQVSRQRVLTQTRKFINRRYMKETSAPAIISEISGSIRELKKIIKETERYWALDPSERPSEPPKQVFNFPIASTEYPSSSSSSSDSDSSSDDESDNTSPTIRRSHPYKNQPVRKSVQRK